jgi:hypothetical protein
MQPNLIADSVNPVPIKLAPKYRNCLQNPQVAILAGHMVHEMEKGVGFAQSRALLRYQTRGQV